MEVFDAARHATDVSYYRFSKQPLKTVNKKFFKQDIRGSHHTGQLYFIFILKEFLEKQGSFNLADIIKQCEKQLSDKSRTSGEPYRDTIYTNKQVERIYPHCDAKKFDIKKYYRFIYDSHWNGQAYIKNQIIDALNSYPEWTIELFDSELDIMIMNIWNAFARGPAKGKVVKMECISHLMEKRPLYELVPNPKFI